MFLTTYAYMYIWVYTGEVNARRVRERYLQAVLRQDIAYFDNVGAGEVATRIQTDTRKFRAGLAKFHTRLTRPTILDLVQQGISEKVAMVVNFLGAFVCGFALAYARQWRLALAMSSMLPCIAIAGGFMNKFITKYMQYAHFEFHFRARALTRTLDFPCSMLQQEEPLQKKSSLPFEPHKHLEPRTSYPASTMFTSTIPRPLI